jgi:hypothetical protein
MTAFFSEFAFFPTKRLLFQNNFLLHFFIQQNPFDEKKVTPIDSLSPKSFDFGNVS